MSETSFMNETPEEDRRYGLIMDRIGELYERQEIVMASDDPRSVALWSRIETEIDMLEEWEFPLWTDQGLYTPEARERMRETFRQERAEIPSLAPVVARCERHMQRLFCLETPPDTL